MDADQIVVLDKGRVAGIGTHKALMASRVVYQRIAHSLSQCQVMSSKKSKSTLLRKREGHRPDIIIHYSVFPI